MIGHLELKIVLLTAIGSGLFVKNARLSCNALFDSQIILLISSAHWSPFFEFSDKTLLR